MIYGVHSVHIGYIYVLDFFACGDDVGRIAHRPHICNVP